MFSRNLNAILQYAPLDFQQLTRILPTTKPFVGISVRSWQSDMRLSERMSRPRDYETLQQSRRSALEAILREEPTNESLRDAMDQICAICEESTWAQMTPDTPFEDEAFPKIDLNCAETAVLLGWAACILGKHFDRINEEKQYGSTILSRIQSEVRRRVFRFASAREEYDFVSGKSPYSLTIAVDIALTVLLLERDKARLERLLHCLFKIIDALIGMHGRYYIPLEESVADIASVANLVYLIQRLTKGAVDLSRTTPDQECADEILFSWISGDYFVNPCGSGMQPQIAGSDVHRIGKIIGDKDLTALGAQLHMQRKIAPRTVTSRMLDPIFSSQMEGNIDKPPRLKYAALRGNRLMTVRMNDLYCAMHTGGGRCNVGEICMFMNGNPLIPFMSAASDARNLPKFNNCGQVEQPQQVCVADFTPYPDRETLSIDLTDAYPQECNLESYQRTIISMRGEHTLRLVEAVRFTAPASAAFTFYLTVRPTVVSGAVRIGQIRLTWEGELNVVQTPLEDGVTELTFATNENIANGMFAFNFELP